MASFFEKLKKGMGVEETIEEPTKEPVEKKTTKSRKTKISKPKKIEIKAIPIEPSSAPTTEGKEKTKEKEEKVEEKKWFESEGELAIDVYQTANDLVIQSAIAGVKPENLDITIEGDVVTIKGTREKIFEEEGADFFSQECYWGAFSREIILPVEVDPNRVTAEMKEGILTIKIPKILREKKRKITVKG